MGDTGPPLNMQDLLWEREKLKKQNLPYKLPTLEVWLRMVD